MQPSLILRFLKPRQLLLNPLFLFFFHLYFLYSSFPLHFFIQASLRCRLLALAPVALPPCLCILSLNPCAIAHPQPRSVPCPLLQLPEPYTAAPPHCLVAPPCYLASYAASPPCRCPLRFRIPRFRARFPATFASLQFLC